DGDMVPVVSNDSFLVQTYCKLKSIPMRLRILRICFVIVYALLNWNKVSYAQCPNGGPFQTVTNTYTTNLASLTDVIYAPIKFNPADGTVMAVDLSISTLGYALLEVINDVGAPITYKITYYRT